MPQSLRLVLDPGGKKNLKKQTSMVHNKPQNLNKLDTQN
jgi:hypothetical protein